MMFVVYWLLFGAVFAMCYIWVYHYGVKRLVDFRIYHYKRIGHVGESLETFKGIRDNCNYNAYIIVLVILSMIFPLMPAIHICIDEKLIRS